MHMCTQVLAFSPLHATGSLAYGTGVSNTARTVLKSLFAVSNEICVSMKRAGVVCSLYSLPSITHLGMQQSKACSKPCTQFYQLRTRKVSSGV